jgi:AcrR family transcriptional regulator
MAVVDVEEVNVSESFDRAAQRRADIVKAAYDVFATRGFHTCGIADIAKRLGIGHGTFYRYFKNKLDIFSHVIDHALAQIIAIDEDPRAATTLEEYRAQVERIGRRLFDLFTSDPHLPKLLFVEALGIDEEISAKLQLAEDALAQLTEEYLKNGTDRGFLRADLDIGPIAIAINAITLEGARRVVRADDPQAERDRWIAAVSSLLFEGIAARDPDRAPERRKLP